MAANTSGARRITPGSRLAFDPGYTADSRWSVSAANMTEEVFSCAHCCRRSSLPRCSPPDCPRRPRAQSTPRQPSGSSGGDRQAVPRGAQPAPPDPRGGATQPAPPQTSTQRGRARTAVPRTTAPPTNRPNRNILVGPRGRTGASYYYRGRYYPYYPFGTVGIYGGSALVPIALHLGRTAVRAALRPASR